MMLLFTVSDRFQIEGRGCVLVTGIPNDSNLPNISRDARIRLRTPDGEESDTFIAALEFVNYRSKVEKAGIAVSLPNEITKDDVPIGTQVFLLDEQG